MQIHIQPSSVTQSCWILCDPMNRSTTGLPVHHQLLEFTQTHVHWISDAIQPSHSLSSRSPPTFSFSQHQDLFKWVSSSHQVAKELEFQLQHQPFQWIFRTDFLYGVLVGSPFTFVALVGRWILYHWTTREALDSFQVLRWFLKFKDAFFGLS